MLAFPSSRFRWLLPGLVCAVLLHGAYGAIRMGPTVFASFILLVLAIAAMHWRHGFAVALPAGHERMSEGVPVSALARVAHGDEPPRQYPVPRRAPAALPVQRTVWSRVKIWSGSLGLLVCGLWWVLLAAMLFMPDPATALDGLFANSSLTLITVSVLLTVLFLVILRSGLRGPSDPLAPDWSYKDRLREQPYIPHSPGGYGGPTSPVGKKRHLRLVRNAP
ncbi:hypothetical protein [Archangium sp.]|uniref:hypothetical protein n=1 Tax=Archangium sp. TaxID=1872627 RepID=UPI002D618C62|nr:hypothetical protein [Archangium sp.]HYO54802.1 hypothetical protein [Archangium sp.]